ncbi:hypothetical protein GTY44_08210 [Streptomyces sp. SID5914]|nr:hypothetical protein [Streptomyces sp. SID5914]
MGRRPCRAEPRCARAGGDAARRCGVPLRPPVPPQRHDCPQRRRGVTWPGLPLCFCGPGRGPRRPGVPVRPPGRPGPGSGPTGP